MLKTYVVSSSIGDGELYQVRPMDIIAPIADLKVLAETWRAHARGRARGITWLAGTAAALHRWLHTSGI